MELVSIIIPTYNRGYELNRAIKSVITQTYKQWEIIIVDNYSSDSTDEVVKSFKSYPIRVYKTVKTGIIAESRNIGIELSQGTLIAFLDSDDWWMPEKLDYSVNAINAGADIVYHALHIVKSENQIIHLNKTKSYQVNEPVFEDLIKNGNALPNSSVVIKKELLINVQGLNEDRDLISWEDYDCWLRVSKITNNFIKLNSTLGFYWDGGGNISTIHKRLDNLNSFKFHYINNKFSTPFWYYYSKGKYLSYKNKPVRSNVFLCKAIRFKKFNYIYKILLLFSYNFITLLKKRMSLL